MTRITEDLNFEEMKANLATHIEDGVEGASKLLEQLWDLEKQKNGKPIPENKEERGTDEKGSESTESIPKASAPLDTVEESDERQENDEKENSVDEEKS